MRLILLVLLGAFLGCGAKPLNPVEGIVTIDGKPLENATVTFSPLIPGGLGSVGVTNAEGKFTLFSLESTARSGAAEGEYEVSVAKVVVAPATQPMMGSTDDAPVRAPSIPKAEIPAEYANPKTSKLRVTVTAGKNEMVKLELSKNPKK